MSLIKSILNSGLNAKTGVRIDYIKSPKMDDMTLADACIITDNGEPEGKGKSFLLETAKNDCIAILFNGKIKEFLEIPGSYFWDPMSEDSYFLNEYNEETINTAKIINETVTGIPRETLFYAVNKKANPKLSFSSRKPVLVNDKTYGNIELLYNVEYSLVISNPFIILLSALSKENPLTLDNCFGSINNLNELIQEHIVDVIKFVMDQHSVSFNKIQAYKNEIRDRLNEVLKESLVERYGISIDYVTIKLNASEESRTIIESVDSKSFVREENQKHKICPKCNKEYPGNFCPKCGEKLIVK